MAPSTFELELATRIKLPPQWEWAAIRRNAGIRRQAVADELGVHVSALGRWETGARFPHDAELRAAYAELLDRMARVAS